ncbi:formyltransferase family protein [Pelagibacteraceae bacterium]|jgi:methionyl-tRNA formyltransferase|nr:formyltransferase family protein [Pelagibacteraceae bacterium]
MEITLFTSNQARHNYLANQLLNVATKLNVVQESYKISSRIVPNHYTNSTLMKEYFLNVSSAQEKLFENPTILKTNKNINLLSLKGGDLNKCSIKFLSNFLKSDIYIVFGSSYIKGELANFLIKNKALNIHMGVSPYYRGTDCNFWALFDGNPHLVGATIHMLSKGLDSGPMLYHALSEIKDDPFLYTMSTVKSAFHSLAERIKSGKIFKYSTQVQDNVNEIRYSKKKEFNDKVVELFLSKKIDLNKKKFNKKLYKDPYFLKNETS